MFHPLVPFAERSRRKPVSPATSFQVRSISEELTDWVANPVGASGVVVAEAKFDGVELPPAFVANTR